MEQCMMTTQQRFNPLYRLILIVFVSLSACGLLGGNRIDCSSDMMAMLKIQPPANAKITSESCSSGINPTYKATFTINPTDLTAFQQATNIKDWQTNADKSVSFKNEAAGMQSLLYGDFGDGAISEEVLIDTSDSQQYIVYFERTFVD
jgi:hypothetical protein